MVRFRAIFGFREMDTLKAVFTRRVTIARLDIGFLAVVANHARLPRMHADVRRVDFRVARTTAVLEALVLRPEVAVLPIFVRITVVLSYFHDVGLAVPATVLEGAAEVGGASGSFTGSALIPEFDRDSCYMLDFSGLLGRTVEVNREIPARFFLLTFLRSAAIRREDSSLAI